jgi:hypothetical protein
MYIPKNTGVILNCYEIHHNEEKYPDSYAPSPTFCLVSKMAADKDVLYSIDPLSTLNASWATR